MKTFRSFLIAVLVLSSSWILHGRAQNPDRKPSATNSPPAVDFGPLIQPWGGGHSVDAYLRAAIAYQSMGKEAATAALLDVARKIDNVSNPLGRLYQHYAVIKLCRMLFVVRTNSTIRRPVNSRGLERMEAVARSNNTYRRPNIGGPRLPGGTKSADWPLEPIELVNEIPFEIAEGYGHTGPPPETSTEYLQYCIENCDWRTERYREATAAEKDQALKKLLSSPKWKKPLTEDEIKFLSDQIK